MGAQLLRWYRFDPTQRVATPSRRWLMLGKNPGFFKASKLVFPGTAGSYISTPDSAALTPPMSTSWELRTWMAATQWLPTQNDPICGQGDGSPANTCFLNYRAGGVRDIRMNMEKPDGSGLVLGAATYPAWADGSEHWLRHAYDPAGPSMAFYWSDDGATWNLISTATLALVTSTRNSTSRFYVGQCDTVPTIAGSMHGYVRRFEMRSPIGGSIVIGFDASQAIQGASSVLGLNGETWTITGGASFQ